MLNIREYVMKERYKKLNIGLILIACLGGAAGVLSSIAIIILIPVMITLKIVRKIKYGTSMFD